MRVLVFTGKGGVGTTTAAAATATLGALRGLRTLVVSTDAAHSLGDVFDAPVGPDPTDIDDRLYAQQVDAQRLLERSWSEVGAPLAGALGTAGAGTFRREEAVVLPGLEELLVMLELGNQLRSGRWDLVVVDGAPTAHALRLLSLPENLTHHLRRLFGAGSGQGEARALRPVQSGGEVAERLHSELAEVHDRLAEATTTVRLVLTPDTVVTAEVRRAFTTLALYDYRVDAIIANRLFPQNSTDPWLRQWSAAQNVVLADVEQSFAGTPIYRSPYRSCEPVGLAELAAFAAEAYGSADAFAPARGPGPTTLYADETGHELRFALPNAQGTDLALARKENQLVLTVGSYRRVLTLPDELRCAEVVGASLLDGQLVVRFGHATGQSGQVAVPENERFDRRGLRSDRRGAWSTTV
ncbi:MAG TPA: ArsA family ATPase [Actinopolymorphaceae bacterium]